MEITPTVSEKILGKLAIRPTVNSKILKKADRLFTGSLEGRITEVIQNARRAGTTQVSISNQDGIVTVRDNGSGIEDFSLLLNLGGSGWDEACEVSEDPAGIGLFSLAPREVTIRSKGKVVKISGDGWVSAPSVVRDDPRPVLQGTVLEFQDESWDYQTVNRLVRYSGLTVYVNNVRCDKDDFIEGNAIHIPNLGCRIKIVEKIPYNVKDACDGRRSWYCIRTAINFHGQVVQWRAENIPGHLYCLVDMTGEPTALRLLLPARTAVVENAALKELNAAIEVAAFQFIKDRGRHTLPYETYLRGRELGIDLPEADPQYHVGTLYEGDGPAPVEISADITDMPDVLMTKAYRVPDDLYAGESGDANIHLLAALGNFPKDAPFVPVVINREYDGYSWADGMPTVVSVEMESGEPHYEGYAGTGEVTLVSDLAIVVRTNDGKTFASPVCMALDHEEHLLVTWDAKEDIASSEAWYHLGGFNDDGDSYDSQLYDFEQDWKRFWANAVGPHEHVRQEVTSLLKYMLEGWTEVRITPSGEMYVTMEDNSEMVISPPMKKAA